MTRTATDKMLRVTAEQIERMYAVVPPESQNGAAVIDALLARALTPEDVVILDYALDGYDAAIDRIEGEWGWMRSTEKRREDGDEEVIALDKARAVVARINPAVNAGGQTAGDR